MLWLVNKAEVAELFNEFAQIVYVEKEIIKNMICVMACICQ